MFWDCFSVKCLYFENYLSNNNITNLSSGESTWNVLSMTVVHCKHLTRNVLGLGRSVFRIWHWQSEKGKNCIKTNIRCFIFDKCVSKAAYSFAKYSSTFTRGHNICKEMFDIFCKHYVTICIEKSKQKTWKDLHSK